MTPQTPFEKMRLTLKYYLHGKKYYNALEALTFAGKYHNGKRKDGVTPEFQHQVEIALFVSSLKDLEDEESAITASLLHDVIEDYNVSRSDIENRFGRRMGDSIWALTKKQNGIEKNKDDYFFGLERDREGSIVKGADRFHNIKSMMGVFTPQKQRQYIDEVEARFIPMIKSASDNFPRQCSAYSNIKQILRVQVNLIEIILTEPDNE